MTIWEVIEKAATSGCTVEVEVDGMVVRIRRGEELKAPKKEAAPAKKAPAKREKKVDHGKILALWDQGDWSVAKIADDVGCSEQTVRNVLEKAGK